MVVVARIHTAARIRVRAPAKAMEARLRSMCTTGVSAVSLSSMTVAARLGVTGVSVPAASARMRSGHSAGYHCPFAMGGG